MRVLFIIAVAGFVLSLGWRERSVQLISAAFFGALLLVLAAVAEL